MKLITEYMEELKEKHGSYYAVAQIMSISQASISIIRKGGGVKDETAIKIAELLGIDASEVLLAAAISRSEGKIKAAWSDVAKRAGIAATVAFVAVLASGFTTWKEAKAGYSEYTLCEVVRRWLKRKAIFTMPVGIVAA